MHGPMMRACYEARLMINPALYTNKKIQRIIVKARETTLIELKTKRNIVLFHLFFNLKHKKVCNH